MTETVSLAILAGGRGQRLGGRTKPLARRKGETLVHQIQRVLGPSVRETFLVAPQDLESALTPFGRVVRDPGQGPGRAVFAAAIAADSEWLFVVAGDHVNPSQALMQRLWSARSGADAVAVCAQGQLQGTYALFRAPAVRALGPAQVRSLHAILLALNVIEVPYEALGPQEQASLADVDTREDAQRYGLELPPRRGASQAE